MESWALRLERVTSWRQASRGCNRSWGPSSEQAHLGPSAGAAELYGVSSQGVALGQRLERHSSDPLALPASHLNRKARARRPLEFSTATPRFTSSQVQSDTWSSG